MKKTNKGFSLVELIIVIAIMAILAGAIAPALIRYIDKSRRSNDVSSAKTIQTAIETALGTEDVYVLLTHKKQNVVVINPNTKTGANSKQNAVTTTCAFETNDGNEIDANACMQIIADNIGEKTPKLKFKKAADKTNKPNGKFYGVITDQGTVYVCIKQGDDLTTGDTAQVTVSNSKVTVPNGYCLSPIVDTNYQ
jgi:prepilin-type N-terminal cleavage/methylation domain-containing protein